MSKMSDFRIEKDSMGEIKVPKEAYYSAQTQRASENFPVSGLRFNSGFISALGYIKYAAANVNEELGLLEKPLSEAIQKASLEIIENKFDHDFVLDIFQTGYDFKCLS